MFGLLILSLANVPLINALVIGPRIYEQQNLGDVSLSEFTYSLSVDCTASTISLIVMNANNSPVKDAQSYLKYIDFSAPLISRGTTDKDGFKLHKLPGDTRVMRGLFVFVIEKNGYRNKEIHFTLEGCYSNYSNYSNSTSLSKSKPAITQTYAPPDPSQSDKQDIPNCPIAAVLFLSLIFKCFKLF